ncbi:MAG: hypothetical protein UDB11_01480 [Peptococcaceae bacterium]|nr:hypothetical protein [Peptococcaceae bacterium]
MKKGLVVCSVLMLVVGVFLLTMGVVTAMLTVLDGSLATESPAALETAIVTGVAVGLMEFFAGCLGLRAAKNTKKVSDAALFGFILLVISVAMVVVNFNIANLCGAVLPLLYFICVVAV